MLTVIHMPDGAKRDTFEIELPVLPLVGELLYIDDVPYKVKKRDFNICNGRVFAVIYLKLGKQTM